MNSDLFAAILAMDAYNRTGAQDTPRGLVLPDGTAIGNATVLSGPGGKKEDVASGFFAQAYDLAGQKIISYRGTDTSPASELLKDMTYGWSTGIGDYVNSQATLAAEFFQQVVGNGNVENLTPSRVRRWL